jgi:hypothetical protein
MTPNDQGSAGKTRPFLFATGVSQRALALLGQGCKPFADLSPRSAAIEYEAPWRQTAMVRYTGGDLDECFDLGIVRRGFPQFGNWRGTACQKEVDDWRGFQTGISGR